MIVVENPNNVKLLDFLPYVNREDFKFWVDAHDTHENLKSPVATSKEFALQNVKNDRPYTLLDLFNVVPTTMAALEYMEQSLPRIETNEEGEVNVATGYIFDAKCETVRTLAHWIPITKSELYNPIENVIQSLGKDLAVGLNLVLTNQILYGDGCSPNLNGLFSHPSIEYLTNETMGLSPGTGRLHQLRVAVNALRLQELPVEVILINPNELFDLDRQESLSEFKEWADINNLIVFCTPSIMYGDCLIGNLSVACTIRTRESGFRFTKSHSDFFVYNTNVALVEQRMVLAVKRPNALKIVSME